MDFLEGLNDRQREAVQHGEGPLLILAGAGSGKTRVITHRIAWLIHRRNVPAHGIVAVTFTNKAAEEMRQRVMALLAGRAPVAGLTVSTFHSFAVRLLRRDGRPLAELRPGFTPQFTIYDEDDQLAVMKSVYRYLGLEEKHFMPCRTALARISYAKNHNQTPEEMTASARDPRMKRLAAVWDEYEGRLRQANALDFDDLLLETVRLLTHCDALREAWNERIHHLLIDEYQDTNRSQYQLMRLLTERRRNVCAVGDEDQSIYSWRGADIRNILEFTRDFPDAAVVRLEQNYRSTKNILEAASHVVAHNRERLGKWLWTAAEEGPRVGLFEAADGEQEALFVADEIERVLARDPEARVAVLYRTNAQSRQFEEALRRYGRRYHVVGGFSFYQRAEIKDVLAYLKVLLSPQDSVSLARIINTPARGIGRTTLEQIEAFAIERHLPLWDALEAILGLGRLGVRAEAAIASFRQLIEELQEKARGLSVEGVIRLVLERTGYMKMLEADDSPEGESRRENLQELVNAAAEAAERGETLAEFLDHAALVSEADTVDERAQVLLLTLHNAKGLEFPVVFITGLEDGLFPHARSLDSPSALEEERRLFYVGMTRAQRRLILTWARLRRRWASGVPEPSQPSRFLGEVPSHCTERLRAGGLAELDLTAERWEVRHVAERRAYAGKTYDSVEAIEQFFAHRGASTSAQPSPSHPLPAPQPPKSLPPKPPQPAQKAAIGSIIEHPRWGRGTVVRREGEGEYAKITVSFPGYGLKKLVERYALRSEDEH
ncbi:MAG: 3'-5' exonuclease [Bryobacterales bacterium]|nr:3'-5' exonuclease [Bryobacterales bacterium]